MAETTIWLMRIGHVLRDCSSETPFPCFHFRYRGSAFDYVYLPAYELSSGDICARDPTRAKPHCEETCAFRAQGMSCLSMATEERWRVTDVYAGLVQAIFGIIESRCPVVLRTTTRCFLVRGPVHL